jgi:hypothetical protein
MGELMNQAQIFSFTLCQSVKLSPVDEQGRIGQSNRYATNASALFDHRNDVHLPDLV